jgi:hypothetical protein
MVNNNEFLDVYIDIYKRKITYMTIREMCNIYSWVRKTKNLKGETADVGVYKGGSAKIIAHFKGNRRLHLFDTFCKMPDPEPIDGFHVCEYGDTLKQVEDLLEGYKDVYFYRGVFPSVLPDTKKYSFVNLDMDLYSGTKDALNYFYPRMVKGGIIISHDYNSINCQGVKRAFGEYFKPEQIIELWDSQCMVIKK